MLTINISEVIWTVINFFLLYFLLKRFLYEPLVRFMDERQARIDAGRNEMARVNSALSAERESVSAKLAASEAEAKRIVAEAGAADEANARRLSARLTDDRNAEKQRLEQSVNAQLERESSELAQKNAELARLLAEKLTGETEKN